MSYKPSPPFLKVRERWMVAVGVAMVIVLLLWNRRIDLLPGAWKWLMLVQPLGLLALFWLSKPYFTLKRRIDRGELPCWECGYDLSAIGETGRCPECGQAFVAAGLKQWWADAEERARGKRLPND